jgi:hypothetical protein
MFGFLLFDPVEADAPRIVLGTSSASKAKRRRSPVAGWPEQRHGKKMW